MKQTLTATLLALTILLALLTQPAQANGPYTVQPGDTLNSIAAQFGLSPTELAAANGLAPATWLYPGQRLLLPQAAPSTWQQPAQTPAYTWRTIDFSAPPDYSAPPVYAQNTVQPHPNPPVQPNNWASAAQTFTPAPAWYPQQPPVFGAPTFFAPPTYPQRPAPIPAELMTPNGLKWIDVNLSTQTLTALEGQTPVFRSIVSTGTWQYPTVVGTFSIYVKYEKAGMSGGAGADAYNLPDVPYVMYFHGDYGLHGTYWHNNFGMPMSHGCVNLPTLDARWLYEWAPLGTRVVTHY